MKIIEKYNEFLHVGIYIIQAIAYTVSFLIISLSIIRSSVIYFNNYNDRLKAFDLIRLDLGESSALALSFISGVEILKLFYIKNYTQLVIVVALVSIKLIVHYFLTSEIEKINHPDDKTT